MVRKKLKGYLLLEVVVYIALISIAMMCTMNIGLFITKNYVKTNMEFKYLADFVELQDRVEKKIEEEGVSVSIINKNKIKLENIYGKTGFIYFYDGFITIVDYDGKTVNLDQKIKSMTVSENDNCTKDICSNKNLCGGNIYIEYVFDDYYKVGAIYEK